MPQSANIGPLSWVNGPLSWGNGSLSRETANDVRLGPFCYPLCLIAFMDIHWFSGHPLLPWALDARVVFISGTWHRPRLQLDSQCEAVGTQRNFWPHHCCLIVGLSNTGLLKLSHNLWDLGKASGTWGKAPGTWGEASGTWWTSFWDLEAKLLRPGGQPFGPTAVFACGKGGGGAHQET